MADVQERSWPGRAAQGPRQVIHHCSVPITSCCHCAALTMTLIISVSCWCPEIHITPAFVTKLTYHSRNISYFAASLFEEVGCAGARR